VLLSSPDPGGLVQRLALRDRSRKGIAHTFRTQFGEAHIKHNRLRRDVRVVMVYEAVASGVEIDLYGLDSAPWISEAICAPVAGPMTRAATRPWRSITRLLGTAGGSIRSWASSSPAGSARFA